MKKLIAKHRTTALEFMKFGTVGFFGFLVDYGLFRIALDIFGFGHYGSALFSFPFGVTFTWVGNRLFTFRGRSRGKLGMEWMRFFIICAGGLILNRGTYSLLTATVPLVYDYPILGLLGGTGAGMFFNFFLVRRHVFR